MIPRPMGCDGNDCDYDEYGRWHHGPGCLSLLTDAAAREDSAVFDGTFADYLTARGWTSRPAS